MYWLKHLFSRALPTRSAWTRCGIWRRRTSWLSWTRWRWKCPSCSESPKWRLDWFSAFTTISKSFLKSRFSWNFCRKRFLYEFRNFWRKIVWKIKKTIKFFRYFKSDLDIKFMFIPQMLFLSCIFIYLCLEIIVKWLFFSWEVKFRKKSINRSIKIHWFSGRFRVGLYLSWSELCTVFVDWFVSNLIN